MTAPQAAKLMIDGVTGRPFVVSGSNDTTPQPLTLESDDLRRIMRALITAASVSNPVIARPYAAAPSWMASTAYVTGQTVRGIGAGNTDNVYLCALGGTSAASGGPTGTGAAGIVDNTARWIYIGKGTASESVPLYSSVTPTASTDVMDGYTAVVPDSSRPALGLTKQYNNLITDNIARFTGGIPYSEGGRISLRGPLTGTLASQTYSSSAERYCWHIKTDCRKWLFVLPTSHNKNTLHIEVNGRPLTEGNYCAASVVSGGGLLLDMSRFGSGAKDVRVYDRNLMRESMHRLFVSADENIWTPSPASNILMAFEGDSITQTGGFGAEISGYLIEQLICKQLGIERWFNNAIGGTGVTSNANGNATTYIERLPGIVQHTPDILLIGGFHNEADRDPTLRKAAMLAYFRAVRAALPNCTVFVTGNQLLGTTQPVDSGAANHLQCELDALEMFNQWADPNSMFIPLVSRSYRFPGSVAADTWFYLYGGAAPFNDSHPCPRYYPAYADLIVQSIKQFFAAP